MIHMPLDVCKRVRDFLGIRHSTIQYIVHYLDETNDLQKEFKIN